MAKKQFENNDALDVERQEDFAQSNSKMPWWFIVIFGYLVFFCFQYTSVNGGRLNYQVYEKFENLQQVADNQPSSGNEDPFYLLGKSKYESNCQACHQPSGAGMAGLAPPLAGSEWVLETKPDRIIRIVQKGLAGPITVAGKEWNLAMVAPGVTEDEEVAAVLTYVRNTWGNSAPAVTTEQVAKIKADTSSKSGLWSANELLAVPVD